MTLAPYQFANFSSGLNLRAKADAVQDAECVDVLNCEFGERGAVRQRSGFVEFTDSELTNRVDSLGVFYSAGGTKQLLAGCGSRLEALDSTGAVLDSETGLSGGPYSFARFAAPGSETAYAGNGTDTLRKWDGSTWTAPTATVDGVATQAMPEAGVLAVTRDSDRLVATGFGTNATGGPDGTASNPSRAYFSEPSDPESWDTTNWVDLAPGDGEQILGAVEWMGYVFIFKETKYFVFTSESTDTTGGALFNYRAVENGIGLAVKNAVVSTRSGIYFLGREGVYFTTGEQPVLISDVVSPMWSGDVSAYFRSDTINHAQLSKARLAWHDERLYLAIPTGSATACDRVLVFDTVHNWWSLYDIPASALMPFRRGDQPELHFGYASGESQVGYLSLSATDDNGTVIASRWRSGWGDYGVPVEKAVRRTEIWGTGTVEAQFSTDWNVAPDSTATVELGDDGSSDVWTTDPADVWTSDPTDVWSGQGQITRAVANRSPRGTTFSTEFRNTPATLTWSVHRVVRHLKPFRPPGQHGGNGDG